MYLNLQISKINNKFYVKMIGTGYNSILQSNRKLRIENLEDGRYGVFTNCSSTVLLSFLRNSL